MSPCRGLLLFVGLLSLACSPAGAAKKPPTPRTDHYGDPLPERALVRLGSARLRVDEEVKAFAFWPDDHTIAACCADGSIRFWERATGREKRQLETGLASVNHAAFIPGGGSVALVVGAQEVLLWDTAAGKAAWKVKLAEDDRVRLLAVAADGKRLAVLVGDKRVDLYEVSSGRKLGSLKEVEAETRGLAFSPDGSLLAVAQESDSPTAPDTKAWVGLWDVRTGKKVRKLGCPDQASWSGQALAFAPDGKTIAVAGFLTIAVFETDTAKVAACINLSRKGAPDGDITPGGLLFSADGKTLVTSHSRGAVRFWDASTGKERCRRQTHDDQRVWPVLSRDGKVLAVASRYGDYRLIHLLNPATGADLLPISEGHTFPPYFVAFTPDGRTVVSADRETVRFWEAATGRPRYRGQESIRSCLALPAEPREDLFQLHFMALTPDRRLLACVMFDDVRLWDLVRGKELPGLKYQGKDAIRAVALTPDGKQLLTVHSRCSGFLAGDKSEGQDGLRVWDVATGKKTKSFLAPTPHRELFAGLVVTSDGSTVIAGSMSGFLEKLKSGYKGWGANLTRGGRLYQWNLRAGMKVRTLEGHQGGILALGLSADDRLLLSAGGDHTCRLWELASGQSVLRLAGPKFLVQTAALSPDGRLIAACGGGEDLPGADPFLIRIYSTVTGDRVLSLHGHASLVRCLAFSPDGRRLASGLRDGTALVWDVTDAQQAVQDDVRRLAAKRAEGLWADLASADAARARQALWCLVGKRDVALPLLREHLKPAEGVERKRLQKLLEDLDSDDFAAREAAGRDLLQLAELAEPTLLAAQKDRPSLELQRRVGQLLTRIATRELGPPQLQAVRAVEVLERIGSPEARHLLRRLAAGAADARLTREARAALERLSQRDAP